MKTGSDPCEWWKTTTRPSIEGVGDDFSGTIYIDAQGDLLLNMIL
jgi:hypothetical protein